MLQMPRIPELAQRDRFVRRAVAEGRVLTLADEESASVPSQKFPGRTVQLFWSSPIEARRWAEALTGDSALQEIPLTSFAADILPGLRVATGLAGADWVSDPIEAEIDPADLLLRLKAEGLGAALAGYAARGEVFVVTGESGPWLEPGAVRGSPAPRLSIFADQATAARHIEKCGGLSVTADPLADFRASTLPWAIARGCVVALEPIAGAGPLDVKAADLAERLANLG
ncbi:MAG: DUF2750 domain-containing protein [Hyphomicrobium sp.]